MMRTMLAVLLLALPSLADDLVLKDGRKVAWKVLVDEGESYAVETREGQKIKVKKADIERIAFDEVGLLTGATFTLDRKRSMTVDLLPKAALAGSDTVGSWKAAAGAVVGCAPGPERARMPFDLGPLPDEYDLSLTLETKDLTGQIAVGLVGGGRQVAYHFDAYDGTQSCLALVGGINGDTVAGRVFQPGKARAVRFMVRRQALIVQVDDKDFYAWKADWTRVSLHESVSIKAKDRLFLCVCSGTWKVSAAAVTRIK